MKIEDYSERIAGNQGIVGISYYIHWNRDLNYYTWISYGLYWRDGKIYRYSEDYCKSCDNMIGESTSKKRLSKKRNEK